MLAGQEKVVMLVEECLVELYQGLPLLVIESVGRGGLGVQRIVGFDTLSLGYNQPGIYFLGLCDELPL